MKPLSEYIPVLDLFYPRTCVACADPLYSGEELVCLTCSLDLPYTRMHDMEYNVMESRLMGRFEFKAATSLLFFVKNGKVQRMMHRLKYEGDKEVGQFMGRMLADELHGSERFNEVDHVITVPLHPRKQKLRGFNQSDAIAQGMEERGYLLVPSVLKRLHDNVSQTRKNMSERWDNVKDIFAVDKGDKLRGKKVLLLDDVLTTGATLEACANALKPIDGLELYVATIACAEY